MKPIDKSFRLDRKARSFSVSNFSIREIPLLLAAFALVALPGLVFGWFSKSYVPEGWRWVVPGFFLLIAAALTGFSALQKRRGRRQYDLSPELQALAKDPASLALAAKRFHDEHPEVPLALAKLRIEEFQRTGA